jgi:predicted enzyme related to lactoylglutathione lyase
MSTSPFRGLYTQIYRVPDLERAKGWYTRAFGVQPYFDEPFYVGFDIAGYELGLQPEEGDSRAGFQGAVAYWGVHNVDAVLARLREAGASPHGDVQDVGAGIRTATVKDPFGNVIGLIENPHFGEGAGEPPA